MKRLFCLLFFCLGFIAAPAAGQNATPPQTGPAAPDAATSLLANFSGRTSISLNGDWNFIVDPYETGLGGHFYENNKPQNKSDLIEYDFDASPTLKVPGDWN